MGEELLSLSTVVDRKTISITSKRHPKGKQYEIAGLADFGPFEYATLLSRQQELAVIHDKETAGRKLTATDERTVSRVLDEAVRLIVIGVEPGVLGELTRQQKEQILFAWLADVTDAGAAEGNAASRRTTAASSRGSRRSTAATRKRGSTRPRGR